MIVITEEEYLKPGKALHDKILLADKVGLVNKDNTEMEIIKDRYTSERPTLTKEEYPEYFL